MGNCEAVGEFLLGEALAEAQATNSITKRLRRSLIVVRHGVEPIDDLSGIGKSDSVGWVTDTLPLEGIEVARPPFKSQLLKWIGNKQRLALQILSNFPTVWNTYHEPFLGSGGVLGTLAPDRACASDALRPLMEIWQLLEEDPAQLVADYAMYRDRIEAGEDKEVVYRAAQESFNRSPNGRDFIFLTRACYGGVVRFRQDDGAMSTPCGAHLPVSTASFRRRVEEWSVRVRGTAFRTLDFREAFDDVEAGDMVYCDPPYSDSQTILYGAQRFRLHDLVEAIDAAKSRGARVALSIDGTKKSGLREVLHDFPDGLFVSEVGVTVGRSMLRRFQLGGESLESEIVRDRLLLTY